ncbi:hypothetical protein [Nonomuraea sp. NPDC049709]|uniref:hypothetical protein n=1 Tax=Nonomuraea sp. NPDC049709 TaxID=3154736 RepID=UPI00342ACD85
MLSTPAALSAPAYCHPSGPLSCAPPAERLAAALTTGDAAERAETARLVIATAAGAGHAWSLALGEVLDALTAAVFGVESAHQVLHDPALRRGELGEGLARRNPAHRGACRDRRYGTTGGRTGCNARRLGRH